jgi:hypothetical protein
MKCKICGKSTEDIKSEYQLEPGAGDGRMLHIFDSHIGDFLSFVENEYLAKLIRKSVLRCYE